MATKIGIQVLNIYGNVLYSVDNHITRYCGECDITPTYTNADCSGTITTNIYVPEDDWSLYLDIEFFVVIEKLLINNIDITSYSYLLPTIRKYGLGSASGGKKPLVLEWDYTSYATDRQNVINTGVHIKYGRF